MQKTFKQLDYQEKALASLRRFLTQAARLRFEGTVTAQAIAAAFKNEVAQQQRQSAVYNDSVLGTALPWVCLRLPTGAGKTYMAARAVHIAADTWANVKKPLVLWLVPSDVILQQTLGALQNPDHPYRTALVENFGSDVDVIGIADFERISPDDFGTKAVIVVCTVQTFRIVEDKKDKRNVYSHNEAYLRHFTQIDDTQAKALGLDLVTLADAERNDPSDANNGVQRPGLTRLDVGRVKHSVVNIMRRLNPIVIVDEAHNGRNENGEDVLRRVGASCVIEFTATPTQDMNVLYHVSAAQLKAEDMIKLPIVLQEHTRGWEDAVRDAVLTRHKLEALAANESDYVRPIMLLQAEAAHKDKPNNITVDALKAHLITAHGVAAHEIALATGEYKELTGIDLMSRTCDIRYVITVQALREGWDCPFAYVLCSIQQISSRSGIEQLLGRVLRMPYAARRTVPELNLAYAHVVSPRVSTVAHELVQLMVDKLGFNKMDSSQFFQPPPQTLFPSNAGSLFAAPQPVIELAVLAAPDLTGLSATETAQIQTSTVNDALVVTIEGEASDAIIAAVVKQAGKKADQAAAQEKLERHNQQIRVARTPSLNGTRFEPMPQLCVWHQGYLVLLEKQSMSEMVQWSLHGADAGLPAFSITTQDNVLELDIDSAAGKMRYGLSFAQQLELNDVPVDASDVDIACMLEPYLAENDIAPAELAGYLLRVVQGLMARGIGVTALLRNRYPLVQALKLRIQALRESAIAHGGQAILFADSVGQVCASFEYDFTFKPHQYPVSTNVYEGAYRFSKHYYPVLADLKSTGEEFECAVAIDVSPHVKHWVRNLVRTDMAFRLPTETGRYAYPDFVCELIDGRVLVIEYKGGHLRDGVDAKHKEAVGRLWASKSDGKGLFLMATDAKTHAKGLGIAQQIAAAIAV
jgi:type III restriction enzyme